MPSRLDELSEELDDDKPEIPNKFPGSKNFKKPEVIQSSEPKRRGRPPGSINKKSTPETSTAQNDWTHVAAIGFGIGTTILAANVFHNPKFKMTKPEAESAAKGVVTVLFHYKQVREFAALINTNSDAAILLRGFYPYISRILLQEVLDNVVSGFFVSQQRSTAANGVNASPGFAGVRPGTIPKSTSDVRNGNSIPTTNVANSGESAAPNVALPPNWRDVN